MHFLCRKIRVEILILLVVGVVIRFIGNTTQGFSGDELYTISVFYGNSFAAAWYDWIVPDPHVPLYYSLVFAWAKIAGHSEFALRSLNGLLGLGFLMSPLVYGRRLFSDKGFVIFFAFVALSATQVASCHEIRPYSLLLTFSMGAILSFSDLVRRMHEGEPVLRSASIFVLFSLLTCATHYFGMAFVYMLFPYLLLVTWKSGRLKVFAAVVIPLVLSTLLWLGYHFPRIENNMVSTTWLYKPNLKFILGFVTNILGRPPVRVFTSISPMELSEFLRNPVQLASLSMVFLTPVAMLGTLYWFSRRYERKRLDWVKAGPSIYMAVVSLPSMVVLGFIAPIVHFRYCVVFLPVIYMSITCLYESYVHSSKQSNVIVGILAVNFFLFGLTQYTVPGEDIRSAMRYAAIEASREAPLFLPDTPAMNYYTEELGLMSENVHFFDGREPISEPVVFVVATHCTADVGASQNSCVKQLNRDYGEYEILDLIPFTGAGVYKLKFRMHL